MQKPFIFRCIRDLLFASDLSISWCFGDVVQLSLNHDGCGIRDAGEKAYNQDTTVNPNIQTMPPVFSRAFLGISLLLVDPSWRLIFFIIATRLGIVIHSVSKHIMWLGYLIMGRGLSSSWYYWGIYLATTNLRLIPDCITGSVFGIIIYMTPNFVSTTCLLDVKDPRVPLDHGKNSGLLGIPPI